MALPEPEVGEFLRRRYGVGVSAVEPLAGGAWSAAYGFVLETEPLVIRFGRYVEDFEKDRLVAGLTAELSELPVPEVLELGPTPDGYFAVSRRAYGTFLDELSGPAMAATLPTLFRALRSLASIDPPGDGYGGFDGWGNAAYRSWADALLEVGVDEPGGRVSGWKRLLAASSWGLRPFESGLRALETLAGELPEPVPRRLVHSDLLHRNVLVRNPAPVEQGELAAVFDWANAMYADPVFDLAWLTYWWPWHPQWRRIDIRKAIEPELMELGPPEQVEHRLLCCLIRIGLEHIAYNAFVGDWSEVDRNTHRTLGLLRHRQGSR